MEREDCDTHSATEAIEILVCFGFLVLFGFLFVGLFFFLQTLRNIQSLYS